MGSLKISDYALKWQSLAAPPCRSSLFDLAPCFPDFPQILVSDSVSTMFLWRALELAGCLNELRISGLLHISIEW